MNERRQANKKDKIKRLNKEIKKKSKKARRKTYFNDSRSFSSCFKYIFKSRYKISCCESSSMSKIIFDTFLAKKNENFEKGKKKNERRKEKLKLEKRTCWEIEKN